VKLGITVSATTIATVLRASGLGPAPRRIGPGWSEFLRAQAQSMLGGGLHSAAGNDGLEGNGARRSRAVQDGEARQLQADDKRSAAAVAEPRLGFSPAISAEPLDAAVRSPCDARTGAPTAIASVACPRQTKSRPALIPRPSAQTRRQSHGRSRPASARTNHASDPLA
jgi:hypothetical protein